MKITCTKQEQENLIEYISEYCNGYGTKREECMRFADCSDCLKSGGKPTCLDSGIEWKITDK